MEWNMLQIVNLKKKNDLAVVFFIIIKITNKN